MWDFVRLSLFIGVGFARNDLSPGRIPVENDEKTGKNCEGLWHNYAIESTSTLSSSIEQA